MKCERRYALSVYDLDVSYLLQASVTTILPARRTGDNYSRVYSVALRDSVQAARATLPPSTHPLECLDDVTHSTIRKQKQSRMSREPCRTPK